MNVPKIPNNSLTEEITELVSLCEQLFPDYGEETMWFSPPESKSEIMKWETEHGVTLPPSFKEWLEFAGDTQILNGTARFYGTKMFGYHSQYLPDDYIDIGELIGDGQYLCFSKSTGKLIWYDHGDSLEYDNFKDVLNHILDLI